MIRKAIGQHRATHPLALEIDFRHEIDRALLVDVEAGLAPGHLDLACPQDDFHCGREKNRVGRAHSATAAWSASPGSA